MNHSSPQSSSPLLNMFSVPIPPFIPHFFLIPSFFHLLGQNQCNLPSNYFRCSWVKEGLATYPSVLWADNYIMHSNDAMKGSKIAESEGNYKSDQHSQLYVICYFLWFTFDFFDFLLVIVAFVYVSLYQLHSL